MISTFGDGPALGEFVDVTSLVDGGCRVDELVWFLVVVCRHTSDDQFIVR